MIYTPNLNFSGTDSFTFKGNDGTSDSHARDDQHHRQPGRWRRRGGGADTRAAIISSAAAIPARWRLGSLLPRFSLAPKGTTIRWRLDEAARTTLTFAKAAGGRRVGSRCVRPTRANRNRRRCTRYVTKGALSSRGKVGLNRVRFQGKLTRTRTLTLGRYRLRVSAVDAAGNRSPHAHPRSSRSSRAERRRCLSRAGTVTPDGTGDGESRLLLAALFLALVGLVALPLRWRRDAPIPGPNGRIPFTSGRDDGGTTLDDNTAQIWILRAGGTATRLTTDATLPAPPPDLVARSHEVALRKEPSRSLAVL